MEDARQDPTNVSIYYGCAVTNLLNDIKWSNSSLQTIRQSFESFSKKYTMLPYLWKKWLDFEENQFDPDYNRYEATYVKKAIKTQARRQFLHEDFYETDAHLKGYIEDQFFLNGQIFAEAQNRSLMYPTTVKAIEKSLCFPHDELDRNFIVYQQNSTRPIPLHILRKYRHSSKLYSDYNMDDENNFAKNLEKMGDKKYVIRSFEHFLGKWPFLKDAWKAYIQYLEKTNSNTLLLTVYSRYCRLFFHDHSLAEEYLEKIKAANNLRKNVSKWWIDLIEYERVFISSKKARASMDEIMKLNKSKDIYFSTYVQWFNNYKMKPFDHSLPGVEELDLFHYYDYDEYKNGYSINKTTHCSSYFTNENAAQQQFVFRSSYITYILKASNPLILQKLFESCKYFFIRKQKILLCHRLGVFDNIETKYFEQSLFLDSKDITFSGIKNITVTNLLQINVQDNPLCSSALLSKIECKIKHLQLWNQRLTFEEFKMITVNKIETIYLDNLTVTKNNNMIFVEGIIEKFPAAKDIRFTTTNFNMYSPKTGENFAKLNRLQNITYFQLYNVPQTLNTEFFKFIQKYAVPFAADIFIDFAANVQNDYIKEFEEKGNAMLADIDGNLARYLVIKKLTN